MQRREKKKRPGTSIIPSLSSRGLIGFFLRHQKKKKNPPPFPHFYDALKPLVQVEPSNTEGGGGVGGTLRGNLRDSLFEKSLFRILGLDLEKIKKKKKKSALEFNYK